jgi:transcriptional regulator with XRE-family HTH domain
MRPKKTTQALAAFGQAVRAYRLAAGLTQEELAEAADLHVGYLGTVERGEKNISLLNIVSLCRALHVAPSSLVMVLDGLSDRPATRARNTK